jgi:hypothetical protein
LKPRILHFYVDLSGETVCGKATNRVRATSHIVHWDSPVIAGGRRCPSCAVAVEKFRALSAQVKAAKP